jgi:hypothetical protein
MPLDSAIEDRRTLDGLAGVVDEALTLADECGWRYALAFLISERVPPRVIQRLISAGARTRKNPKRGHPTFSDMSSGWKGGNRGEMIRLFEALRHRRPVSSRGSGHPPASRSTLRPCDKD